MDRTERFHKIESLLRQRKVVPIKDFMEELEVSRATFKRDIEYLRDRLHAPIEWDRSRAGYKFLDEESAAKFELPGLWFNASEIHALLTMQSLLKNVEPGLLAPHVEPLIKRLRTLINAESRSVEEVDRRVRIISLGARGLKLSFFESVALATLERKRLKIRYQSRSKNEETEREISPQRIVHYRSNWYVDGWCHLRNGIKTFSIDGMKSVSVLVAKAKAVPEAELDHHLTSSYGIFSGQPKAWAMLRFSAKAARWVGSEVWHPNQRSSYDNDGSYVLELPFNESRELVMDVLRYGPDVEVVAPSTLRREVHSALRSAANLYRDL
jgi:predicted DNA-binding transcriptional regulator YafY